ncbi:MAG: 3-oxoacyl-ACP reductase FabG [Deltaproteobacteria bacterium]|nr:3-oxoacyl-ACP reductase FabG [Deltaproteobacteria bacterium]
MTLLLEGKRALVTGGTGALGSAIARILAREGATVAFGTTSAGEKADRVAAAIRKEGRTALPLAFDVADAAAVQAAVSRCVAELGGLDILVNAAGISQAVPLALMREDDWDRMLAVNLRGVFLVCRAALRPMVAQRAGVIVNVGSVAGRRMLDAPVHYAASKAGVSGFTLALAREVARYGIRVTCVVPGLLRGGVGNHVPPALLELYGRRCVAGRVGEPDEIAEVVAFLASDRASYVYADDVFVDGGV